MQPISAVIITYNEEKNIGRCLDSLQSIADEIIVLDSFSTDNTEEICSKRTVKFIKREWQGYSKSKNFANGLAAHDYILSIDADEALSPELQSAIQKLKKEKLNGAYKFNRLTNYCGKWIRYCGWYPDKKTRIFPKNKAKWVGYYVHEKLVVENDMKVFFLNGDMLHYSYYTIEEHIKQTDKFSTIAANELFVKGKKSSLINLYVRPVIKFIHNYLFRLGLLDGYYGFRICKISARSVYLKYFKLKQLYKK